MAAEKIQDVKVFIFTSPFVAEVCFDSFCVSKIYHRIHITENCLTCNRFYSVYHAFTLCVTVYLANRRESRRRPMVMLAADVSEMEIMIPLFLMSTRQLNSLPVFNISREPKAKRHWHCNHK